MKKTRVLLIAANEGTLLASFAAANEISIESDWLRITPYGDYPNKVGLQRVTREDADAMVTAFNSVRGRATRAFMGLPIYVGHPDVDPANYPDKRRYGKITDLETRADGLYGKVAFNTLGKAVMDDGQFLFNSPTWHLRRDGKFVRPVQLVSVGLTNTPQIPGDPWAKNENENNTTKMKWLIDLLVSKGLMKSGGTEEEAQTAVNALVVLPTKVLELEGKLTTATNERTSLTTERDTLKASNATLNTEVTTLRTARVTRELDLAFNSGRIKQADRVSWNDKLVADFDSGLKELHGLKIGINTKSHLGGLGNRKGEGESSGEKITAINSAVQEYAHKHGLNLATNDGHNQAFAAVKKAQPALFT